MLKNKTVVLGVTGSIAAYKAAALASQLKKQRCHVEVIMTKNACQFINPVTFESLTGNKCLVDTFDRNFQFQVEHIALAKRADLAVIAPASANVIGKLVNGIADDMLTTTLLACKCKKLLAPAMNTNMFENPIVQRNLSQITEYNYEIIQPACGYLACGDTGAGKMQEPERIMQYIMRELAFEKDLAGKKLLITAGPTQEAIDPVRYITNHSTGKMGFALAKMAMLRGADVTLIKGPVNIDAPPFVNVIDIVSAADLFEAVQENAAEADIIIMSAAVADFTPVNTASEKIKKASLQQAEPNSKSGYSLDLKSTIDILAYLGENKKTGQILCGFSMETEHLLENSKKKLKQKNADLIAANPLKTEGAGFGADTNVVILISKQGITKLPKMSKGETALKILDELKKL